MGKQVEYARNVLNLNGANTQEIEQNPLYPVVVKMPLLRIGMKEVEYEKGVYRFESHWHNYCFNPMYEKAFRNTPEEHFGGFDIIFTKDIINIAEIMKIREGNSFFTLVQFHPEYQSSKDNPHPIIKEFLEYAKEYKRNL